MSPELNDMAAEPDDAPLLPAEFADLERFAARWCLPTERARVNRRIESTMSELRGFYDALLPRFDAVLEYLNRFPVEKALPNPQAERLQQLAYSMCEATLAVENFGQPRVVDGFDIERVVIVGEEGRSF